MPRTDSPGRRRHPAPAHPPVPRPRTACRHGRPQCGRAERDQVRCLPHVKCNDGVGRGRMVSSCGVCFFQRRHNMRKPWIFFTTYCRCEGVSCNPRKRTIALAFVCTGRSFVQSFCPSWKNKCTMENKPILPMRKGEKEKNRRTPAHAWRGLQTSRDISSCREQKKIKKSETIAVARTGPVPAKPDAIIHSTQTPFHVKGHFFFFFCFLMVEPDASKEDKCKSLETRWET